MSKFVIFPGISAILCVQTRRSPACCKFRACGEAWYRRAEILSISDGLCSVAWIERAAGLFARQVLGTLAYTSIRNQRTNSIFSRRALRTRSSFRASWLKIPRNFRILCEIYRRINEKRKCKKKKQILHSVYASRCDRSVSVSGIRSFMNAPRLRTHVDNGRASSGSSCFHCNRHHYPSIPYFFHPRTVILPRPVCVCACVCVYVCVLCVCVCVCMCVQIAPIKHAQ